MKGRKHPGWKGAGELSGAVFGHIRNHAKARNIKFEISVDDCWKLFVKQNKKCALTGLDITIRKRGKQYTKNDWSASLDRIDSNKGYELGNVQWVHKDVNLMKLSHPQDKFIALCKAVAKHNSAFPSCQFN